MSSALSDSHNGRQRFYNVSKMRTHDYLYDTAFIVSGARDYARSAFKSAMQASQLTILPVFETMFSEQRHAPRVQMVYYTNCRMPKHMDPSYEAYLKRSQGTAAKLPRTEPAGRDRYKFVTFPRKVLPLHKVSPQLQPPSSALICDCYMPVNRGMQTMYRESSAQTRPWQPDGFPNPDCEETPEVLYLDKLQWGPGIPYRTGDLPADFHTTEIINKMRHCRRWMEVIDNGVPPKWMKRKDAIMEDIETKDWIFREAEIDELQEIRLTILHKLMSQQNKKQSTRTGKKLAKRWEEKKTEMEKKIDLIHRSRDREIRKLTALHMGGGRLGLVDRMRASRGAGSVTAAATDPMSDIHAPVARHGYQARKRHADITFDASLLQFEDHEKISKPPTWLNKCGQDLKKTCSGHYLEKKDVLQLCERETKWTDKMLENLHNELKKARLGAANITSVPLRVLKPRVPPTVARPSTPEVQAVPEEDESCHQAALLLQRLVRGRAAQLLMYEGRTRAAELTEELKTTHGLQLEDKQRIAKEEARAREYNAVRTDAEKKDDAITALVDELCGGAVSAALDFLEKELRRLHEERRHHAYILIALRDKTMREAAEAGRRQKELHRRREHDEVFKQVLGVTQETVEVYLQEIIDAGVKTCAEEEAVENALTQADLVEASIVEHGSMSTAEQNEMVAELVQHFLLPEAHKMSSRQRIAATQEGLLEVARNEIFSLLDTAEMKIVVCTRCGEQIGDKCRCRVCPIILEPVEKPEYRSDPRWNLVKHPAPPPKTLEERYPPAHDIRCMLECLLDDVVVESREHRQNYRQIYQDFITTLLQNIEIYMEAQVAVEDAINIAMGITQPIKKPDYCHYSRRIIGEALQRSTEYRAKPCPKELPSQIREEQERMRALQDPACRCTDIIYEKDVMTKEELQQTLPSKMRQLTEKTRCKCDAQRTRVTLADFSSSSLLSGETLTYSPSTAPGSPRNSLRSERTGEEDGQE